MSNPVLFETDRHIGLITLNRPEKLNSVTPEMSKMITETIEKWDRDDNIRCIIITGAEKRAFCAGSDIKTLDQYETPWSFRNRTDYCDAIYHSRKPMIAAVNGYALGGGLETALSCDIRIASDTAKFAAPEIKLGWIGGGGMAAMLAHSIGASNAAMMIMTGDMIDAEQAKSWSLITETLPADKLLERAKEIAHTIASRAPIAAETAKKNLRAAVSMPLADAMAYERDLQTICFATEDAKEGRAAFAERRDPLFKKR